MRKIFLAITIFISALFADLPQAIEDFIYKDKIDRSNLSIVIKNKATDTIEATLNANVSRVPASVEKIATTYAALLELGENFKWPTQIYYRGKINKSKLVGDLIVKAFGDPTLSPKDVHGFAKKIRSYGIKKITGDIIIDRSFFKNSNKLNSGFDRNFVSEYNAMPDALMFNDHLNTIIINPTSHGIEAFRAYDDRSFRLENHIKMVNGSCRGSRAWPKIKFVKEKNSVAVILSGKLSNRCRKIYINKVLSRPYVSFFYAFKTYLAKEGIDFKGNLVLAKTPKNAKILFTHLSKPLIKIVAKTLKKSNNLYARHIFLILGAKRYGYPATLQKSQRAIRDILGSRGLIDSSDFIVNGCGLSRKSRLKPMSAIRIMDDAYKTFGEKWLKALSIAGVDGTINKRFKYSVVKNRAFMKTGTLKRAKNIAGFVKAKSGTLYNVAIFYNGAKIWLGRDVQNKIITWLVKNR